MTKKITTRLVCGGIEMDVHETIPAGSTLLLLAATVELVIAGDLTVEVQPPDDPKPKRPLARERFPPYDDG